MSRRITLARSGNSCAIIIRASWPPNLAIESLKYKCIEDMVHVGDLRMMTMQLKVRAQIGIARVPLCASIEKAVQHAEALHV